MFFQIPGCEGRAGMAAVAVGNDILDMEEVFYKIENNLAFYSRPIFIRVAKQIELTCKF